MISIYLSEKTRIEIKEQQQQEATKIQRNNSNKAPKVVQSPIHRQFYESLKEARLEGKEKEITYPFLVNHINREQRFKFSFLCEF